MGGIEEQAPEMVKTIAKQALGRALMLLEADRLALVFPDPDLEAPTKGQNQEGEEPLDALRLAQMGVLEIEAARFEATKQGFYAPAAQVIRQRRLGRLIGGEDDMLPSQAKADQINLNPPDRAWPIEHQRLAYSYAEQPLHGQPKVAIPVAGAGVIRDAQPKRNALGEQKAQPVAPAELAVGRQAL